MLATGVGVDVDVDAAVDHTVVERSSADGTEVSELRLLVAGKAEGEVAVTFVRCGGVR